MSFADSVFWNNKRIHITTSLKLHRRPKAVKMCWLGEIGLERFNSVCDTYQKIWHEGLTFPFLSSLFLSPFLSSLSPTLVVCQFMALWLFPPSVSFSFARSRSRILCITLSYRPCWTAGHCKQRSLLSLLFSIPSFHSLSLFSLSLFLSLSLSLALFTDPCCNPTHYAQQSAFQPF